MTDRAQPGAIDSLIRNDELAQVFGRFSEGFVVPGSDPTPAAQRRGDIDETALAAFSLTTSSSSLDVTVAPGEAFVSGWVCRDVSTTLTLPANSTVDIVVGFDPDAIFDPQVDADRDAADETVVDLAGNVDATTPTTTVHQLTTDGSGVTSNERVATVGSSASVNTLEADDGSFNDSITDPEGNTVTSLSDPVRVTEEASTFTESNVTVTNNNTTVSNGSIELSGSKTSGDAVVSFDSGPPADIDSWDLATFQRTLDGETVTVDVETIQFDVFEDFEDGDISISDPGWSGWSGDTGSFFAQQSTVIDGSYSGELSSSSAFVTATADRGVEITDSISIKVQIGSDTGANNDNGHIILRDSVDNTLGKLRFLDNDGEVVWDNGSDNTVLSSWSAGTTYRVEFSFDFRDDNVTISIDASDEGTFNLQNSVSGVQKVIPANQTNGSGSTRSVYVDSFATGGLSDKFTDIGQDFDISSIDTSKNLKFRANLSRADTANNPTVDYLARRFSR